jgi:hypothetical protein
MRLLATTYSFGEALLVGVLLYVVARGDEMKDHRGGGVTATGTPDARCAAGIDPRTVGPAHGQCGRSRGSSSPTWRVWGVVGPRVRQCGAVTWPRRNHSEHVTTGHPADPQAEVVAISLGRRTT